MKQKRQREKHLYKNYNTQTQFYKGVPLNLIVYTESHFARLKAKRFVINHTNQNLWIPNVYLLEDGTIKPNINIDFVLYNNRRQIALAGVTFNDTRERTVK